MLSDAQVADEVRDIENEMAWPLWPVLPMKWLGHTSQDGGHGVLTPASHTRIYLIGLLDIKPGISLGEQFKDVPTLSFESVEAMVREGWVSD